MKKLIVVSLTLFVVAFSTVMREKENMIVKTRFPRMIDFDKLDPASIRLDYEYTLLEHIYSPLIELGEKGELVAGVAENFEWVGTEAHLKIRDDLKLSNGKFVSPEDVEASIKRQIILDTNLHGRLNSILCPNKKLTSLEDPCENMQVVGDKVIFKLPYKMPFLFRLLASLDYAVIPKVALDEKTLKIKDFKISSGPYNIEKILDDKIILAINKNHYHYSENAPQKIEYIVSQNTNSLDLLDHEEIDLITPDDYSAEPQVLAKHYDKKKHNIHQTFNIKSNLLVFTDKGVERLSKKRRLKIGKIIRRAFEDELKGESTIETAYQFFPDLGESSLKGADLTKVKEQFDIDISNEDGNGVDLVVSALRVDYFEKILRPHLPKINIIKNTVFPSPHDKSGKSGDMFICHTDTGFIEQIGLLSYSSSFGYFDQTPDESKEWLDQYMKTENKNIRQEMLNKVHLDSLMRPRIVPLYNTSYVALSNINWKMNFSQFYSNVQLWRLRKQ